MVKTFRQQMSPESVPPLEIEDKIEKNISILLKKTKFYYF